MKILIAGLPKTGTTALMFKIGHSAPGPSVQIFEPIHADGIYQQAKMPREQLDALIFITKILCTKPGAKQHNLARLPNVDYASFQHYDKKVFLIRDPRDNLVSLMLYMIVNTTKLFRPRHATGFVELLERKQAAPGSVSLVEILEYMSAINECNFVDVFTQWMSYSVSYHDTFPGYELFHYEDLVDERFNDLEAYLGFALTGDAQVGPRLSRVVRTKGSGDWRNWFTAADVERFRPIYADYMQRHGYKDDWEPAAAPVIDPAHGSDYVRRIVNEYYEQLNTPARL